MAWPLLAVLTAAARVPGAPKGHLPGDLHSLGAQGRWPGMRVGVAGFTRVLPRQLDGKGGKEGSVTWGEKGDRS